MAYPVELHRRVLAVKAREGLTYQQTADCFDIGIASLVCWNKHIEQHPCVPRKGPKIKLNKLRQDVQDYPDAYQYEHAAHFDVTPKAIWQALRKLGVTYKKSCLIQKQMPTNGVYSRRKCAPMKGRQNRLFTLTRTTLLMICQGGMAMRRRVNAVTARMIGMQEAAPTLLGPCGGDIDHHLPVFVQHRQ